MAAEKIPPILEKAFADSPLDREGMVALLSLPDGRSADRLFNAADVARKEAVGDDVPIRGIIEFSNVCFRNCLYCGLRKDNGEITRYRMPDEEIVATALRIREAGVGTVVLQSGEDPFYHGERLAELTDRKSVV